MPELNIIVSDKTKELIERIQNRLPDDDLSKVIAKAIDLLDVVSYTELQGSEVYIHPENGKLVKLTVFNINPPSISI